jgi:hypothetical protein
MKKSSVFAQVAAGSGGICLDQGSIPATSLQPSTLIPLVQFCGCDSPRHGETASVFKGVTFV